MQLHFAIYVNIRITNGTSMIYQIIELFHNKWLIITLRPLGMHSYAFTIFGKDPGDESFSFTWYNIKHDNIIQLSLLISSYILFLILRVNCACIVASFFTDIPRSFLNAATTGSVDTKALFPVVYTYQKHCYSEKLDKYDAFCTCFWDTSTVAKHQWDERVERQAVSLE